MTVGVLGCAELEGELLLRQGLQADAYLDRPVRFDHIIELAARSADLQISVVRRGRPDREA